MKSILTGAVLLAFAEMAGPSASAQGVYYQGYYRNNGTYVAPHYQSAPDHSYNNNWSVSPNVNPYTGSMGTRPPTFNDRSPSYGRWP